MYSHSYNQVQETGDFAYRIRKYHDQFQLGKVQAGKLRKMFLFWYVFISDMSINMWLPRNVVWGSLWGVRRTASWKFDIQGELSYPF